MCGIVRVLRSWFDDGKESGSVQELVVIALNYVLPEWTLKVWSRAKLRLCADGGANRMLEQFPDALPPHAIVGDLDSARGETLEIFRQAGSEIVDLSQDQDSTDLQKCVAYVIAKHSQCGDAWSRNIVILALGAFGGRLDHTLSNLSSLGCHRNLDFVLIGDGNAARLLRAGEKSKVYIQSREEGPMCGLVPFDGPAVVTTKGLKYNVSAQRLQFGKLISTSNTIESDEVTETTPTPPKKNHRPHCHHHQTPKSMNMK